MMLLDIKAILVKFVLEDFLRYHILFYATRPNYVAKASFIP
ncbi:hypothetical protein SAMN05660841_02372 [Sphingobacterium nematocida]|uniref:Uncharacterized protein n=1 Tax=Sphingobacterium nematocida TaxID=1513896 RepID=A0A1T5E6F1_9SPHI|nr:hypothetical protein SAMN05660841_02372 [Sphingobacterium nematocida]